VPHSAPLPDWLGVAVAGLIALGYLVPYLLWVKVLEPRLLRRRAES
jgi:hypothetical protein